MSGDPARLRLQLFNPHPNTLHYTPDEFKFVCTHADCTTLSSAVRCCHTLRRQTHCCQICMPNKTSNSTQVDATTHTQSIHSLSCSPGEAVSIHDEGLNTPETLLKHDTASHWQRHWPVLGSSSSLPACQQQQALSKGQHSCNVTNPRKHVPTTSNNLLL
jgi:hypothetical protein